MTRLEHDLIPYAPESLRGEKLLVLAPHPDDEVIGCGGLIHQHALEGRRVRVLVATDGTAAGSEGTDDSAYRSLREEETRNGLAILGIDDIRFLRLKDRSLDGAIDELKTMLVDVIRDFHPDVILAPSPIEIHPDHVALCRALIDALHGPDLAPDLALTRIAFYEVSQPFRPNLLADITDAAAKKFEALAAHASQLAIRDYRDFAEGLGRYRAMTLEPGSRYAEGYCVVDATDLRAMPWSRICSLVAPSSPVEIVHEVLPITVIVRTKNRLAWLKEALESIGANDYPASVVVVNDGGASPRAVIDVVDAAMHLIDQPESRGRSEAMNAGVKAAESEYLAFLDDDDIYYPEHLGTLAAGIRSASRTAVYTDAISAFMEMSPDGRFEASRRARIYASDYDADLLHLDNYIPLTTLLLRREDFLEAGGFDPEFDLFEDWDFLLRLSRLGSFSRIPRVTCEIRHFPDSASAVLATPEGTDAFRAAKLKIWRKHPGALEPQRIARVLESLKRASSATGGQLIEQTGRSKHLEIDVARLERDKKTLIEELQHQHARIGEILGEAESRGRELAARIAELERHATVLDGNLMQLGMAKSEIEHVALQREESLRATFAEIERLNSLLEEIYSSKSWKLHSMIEGLRRKRV